MTTVTSPSSPDWLTRLRTSKGFPDSHHTDLEHFLSTSLPQSPPPTTPKPKPPPADVTSPHPPPPHDVISNVLSDLFCFGNPNTTNTQKISRKQNNPQQYLFAKTVVVSVSPKVRTSRKQASPKVCLVAKSAKVRESIEEEVVVEEEDFTGFTETEVTVIDTSVASWKFDKVLYRRKNEWRVGEKRRRNGGEEDRDGEKKKKKDKKLKLCGQWKARDKENGEKTKMKNKKKKKLTFVDKEGDVAGSKFVQGHDQGKAMVAASEKKQDSCSQVQEKRVLNKPIDDGPSVILIKSIPITNKKDMSGGSKSCVKLQK